MTLPQFPTISDAPLAALAFDYGTQRIGVAYGQSLTGTAQPVAVLKAIDGIPVWDEIAALIRQWQPQVFVIGMPYNMDGSDSEILPRAIKFANRLHGRFNLPSFGIDERLSSREARTQLEERAGAGRTGNSGPKKKAAIDAIAAQIILKNWFSEWQLRQQP
ncbi:MAG: Holliday junction resolvase RuvX [Gammaproteobacteria bacterium]|nr:Holliday junction resolvase RuvX [Gammaproteobacteria bacterium]